MQNTRTGFTTREIPIPTVTTQIQPDHHSVRTKNDFQTLIALSTSSNIPLITFWTTSWCPTCKIAGPLIRDIIESPDGRYLSGDVKVGFAEVEVDAPDVGYGLGARYMVCSTFAL